MAVQNDTPAVEDTAKKSRRKISISLNISTLSLILSAVAILLTVNLWLWVPSPWASKLSFQVEQMTSQWKNDTATIEADYRDWKDLLTEQKAQAVRMETMLTSLESALSASSNQKMLDLLIEQEVSYQAFLANLKNGMEEMSAMVRGSRSWLDEYNLRMTTAEEASRLRLERLKQLQNSIKRSVSQPMPTPTPVAPPTPAS
ncbi:hypothetical protein ACKC9G_03175 [Pokkaliibacter sp. CJK22405]|uniref:hypothetical protein n=1 Tax=Pokkaliibacter sp. CJK22405 TaxID=3384615 RepID=UPI0039847A39